MTTKYLHPTTKRFTSFCNLRRQKWLLSWRIGVTAGFFILFVVYINSNGPIPPDRSACINNKCNNNIKSILPVIVWYTDTDENEIMDILGLWFLPKKQILINCPTRDKVIQCDVTTASNYSGPAAGYIFYGSLLKNLPLPRDPKIIWGLFHEETPNRMPVLWNEAFLNLFNFSCTFSRYSDVPMPLAYLRSLAEITDDYFFIDTKAKNMFLSKIAPVLYLQSKCNTSSERDAYVKELMKYISIDSYGKCINNKQFPERMSYMKYQSKYISYIFHPEHYKFIAKYKFVIAIENAACDDYVTEKFWSAIYLGVVPIYYGSRVIRDWLPNKKSAILLEDYHTPEFLSKHLYELLGNDSKYEEYLEHKTKRLITNRRLLDELTERPNQTEIYQKRDKLYCIMCERIHEFGTNSSRVNIVTKKHYNCSLPTSVLTRTVNRNSPYFKEIGRRPLELSHA